MSLSEVLLSYDSAAGEEEGIRTFTYDGKLHFSLYDVVRAIQRENSVLDPNKNSKSIITLIKAHITHLLPREIHTRTDLPENLDQAYPNTYVTKAGLLRVVLQDNSPACLKFQEWVLEDVLPAVLEKGQYQHPSLNNTSVPSTEDFDVETMLRLQLQETIERKKADAELKKEISTLGNKLETIEKVVNSEQMIFVSDHELVSELPQDAQYDIFSRCNWLCSKDSHIYRYKQVSKTSDVSSRLFSRNTIDEAMSYVK
ncbi:TPA: BRO family protein [Vibrio parahaemolyticus]|uniref:BRO family protein n=1 Tax=Vibrio parahaemolyticus TaxID=670 RepID=UPI00038E1AFE|nr:BRO family protein [Vibrio parahaemolyticus]EGR1122428.1 hypothetical protein [Vibrio parahaemolyticus]EJG0417793.1 hypothetical protein [Vibrio parahaemolyticus]EJG0422397.1 hypothetical protein [Vibrio parahaemolyticus]EQM12095.1 BRO family, N-terminal domain protein [Vibrio parahaemolyticus 3259]ETJ84737.1 BRO family, N-terminal domain protein [Vibrio parahaemolyticus EKP-008]